MTVVRELNGIANLLEETIDPADLRAAPEAEAATLRELASGIEALPDVATTLAALDQWDQGRPDTRVSAEDIRGLAERNAGAPRSFLDSYLLLWFAFAVAEDPVPQTGVRLPVMASTADLPGAARRALGLDEDAGTDPERMSR
jgi:hypothetical protein